MKKIIRNREMMKATRKFTDRELPRQVFWDKYEQMKQNIHNLEDIYIISYYGVGGIGKSSLLRKIIEELKEKEEKPYYVLHDFESAQDAKGTLLMLRNKLEEMYKFEFPLFDLALYAYAKKIGESAQKPEVQSFIEKSKVLSLLSQGVEEIPLVGIAAKVLRYADSTVAILRSASKNNKEDLLKIERETEEETYKNLPYYFSQDLAANIEKLDKPFVILLDTYEKLVNELSDEGYSIMKDLWLRSDNGPILQVPGVLWVIAGREKIKWGEYDKDWEETLEQHILGDLSFNDANEFLEEAGIVEPELRKQIYELTNGTPVYLDICVDTYELLRNREEEITIDKFGINIEELVERYIRYMDSQTSEMVYLLSNIENWNDEMIQEIGPKILPNFSIVLYNKIKELSFILEDNSNYYMHKTVRNIFQKECPNMIRNKALEVLDAYYFEKIESMSGIDKDYEIMIDRYLANIWEYMKITDANDELFNISYALSIVEDHSTTELFIAKAEEIYQKLYPKYHEGWDFYHIEMLKVSVLYKLNRLYEARAILDKQIDKMIANDDYLPVTVFHDKIVGIYCQYPNYETIPKLISWIEKCQYQKEIMEYVLIKLNGSIGNIEYATKLAEEKLKSESISDGSKCALLEELLLKFQHDSNCESNIENYKRYALEMEKVLENGEIKDFIKYNGYLVLASYYNQQVCDYEKAYYYAKKMEVILEKKLEQFPYTSMEQLAIHMPDILEKANRKQELQEFCTKWYERFSNELDTHNITVTKMRIHLLKRIKNEQEIENMFHCLEEENDLEALYNIAKLASNINYHEKASKFAQKAIEKIKQEGLENKNIVIFKKIVLEIFPYIGEKELVKYMDELSDYYEKNCLDDYNSIKYDFLKMNVICRQIDEEHGRIYLDKLRKIAAETFGNESSEIADIENQLGHNFSEIEQHEEAIKCYDTAAKIYQKIYGEDHKSTITAETNKIVTYVEIDYQKGIHMLEEYYKMKKARKIEETSLYHILDNLIRLKRKFSYPVAEVMPQLEEIITYYQKIMGNENRYIEDLVDFIKEDYIEVDSENADELTIAYNEAIRNLLIKLLGKDNSNVKKVENMLSMMYSYVKKHKE